MKKIFKKIQLIFIILLIIVGIGIILAPWLNAWRFDVAQRRIMALWYDGAESTAAGGAWTHSVAVIGGTDNNEILEEDVNPNIDVQYLAGRVEGIITIERINLRAPIINEYSEANLNVSICSVIPGNRMGEPGNYVLAGHESRIFGRHFNRLHEVEVGDVIIVENRYEQFIYLVNEVFTVTPEDVWVMDNDGDRKIITLITCDSRTNPIGRLIVKGELYSE